MAVATSTLVLVLAGWGLVLLGLVLLLVVLGRRRNPWRGQDDRRAGRPDRRGEVRDRRRGLPDTRELRVDRRRGPSDRRGTVPERRRAYAAS